MAKLQSPSGRVLIPDDKIRVKIKGIKIVALGKNLQYVYKIRN